MSDRIGSRNVDEAGLPGERTEWQARFTGLVDGKTGARYHPAASLWHPGR